MMLSDCFDVVQRRHRFWVYDTADHHAPQFNRAWSSSRSLAGSARDRYRTTCWVLSDMVWSR
jgi:hypothetical protein